MGEVDLLNSEALTKFQSLILVAIIVVAAVGGAAIYVLLGNQNEPSEAIRIGVCADIDNLSGSAIWRGTVLAAEQVNAEGGVLGRNFEIVAEDDDSEALPGDLNFAINALNRLIAVDEADFIIYSGGLTSEPFQEIGSQHQKLVFQMSDNRDELSQKVLNDYEKYKYFFRAGAPNSTSVIEDIVQSFVVCREHTGFNKIAILSHDVGIGEPEGIDVLREHGFEVVYTGLIPLDTVDFSSYFAQAEAKEAEIIYPLIWGSTGIPFLREYYERQSPTVMWGAIPAASTSDAWETVEGKCEYLSLMAYPVAIGHPLTTKTLPTREAYMERWNEEILSIAAAAYDVVRFILPDAIERAGTIETDAVIAALEKTEIETSLARKFAFTSSHDIMVGQAQKRLDEGYFFACLFQWQDGTQVPVYPIEIMNEVGATYKYPPWSGPWDDL